MIQNEEYKRLKTLREFNPKAYNHYLELQEIRKWKEIKEKKKLSKLNKFLDGDEINSRGINRILEHNVINQVKSENFLFGAGLQMIYGVKNYLIDSAENYFYGYGKGCHCSGSFGCFES